MSFKPRRDEFLFEEPEFSLAVFIYWLAHANFSIHSAARSLIIAVYREVRSNVSVQRTRHGQPALRIFQGSENFLISPSSSPALP